MLLKFFGILTDALHTKVLVYFSNSMGAIKNLLDGKLKKGKDIQHEKITLSNNPAITNLDEINSLVRARHGWFLANGFDYYLGKALIDYGEYAEVEHSFLSLLLQEGDNVIEVGANIGSHTVGLAKSVGSTGHVVAIEPQPEVFRILCANLALNGLTNAIPFMNGCGAESCLMRVNSTNYQTKNIHNSGSASLNNSDDGTLVSVVTLDELVGNMPSLRLIKVDVEGMEKEVLEGAKRLIEQHRPFLYVENDRAERSKELIELIMGAGYRLWWHTPLLFNPENFFGNKNNSYENNVSINMICVPKEITTPLVNQLHEIIDPDYHLLNNFDKA